MFLADRYVEGICPYCDYEDARGDQCDQCGKLLEPEQLQKPRCKVCGSAPVLQETSHLYLALDALQDRLKDWVHTSQVAGSWTRNAVQTTAAWLELDHPLFRISHPLPNLPADLHHVYRARGRPGPGR